MKGDIILALASVVSVASCSLNEKAESFVDRSGFFETTTQMEAAVNSAYAQLRNLYSFRFFTLTEAHSDLIYEPAPTVTEARMEISPSQPGYSEEIWQRCYQEVMYCNWVIEGIKKSSEDDENKLPYIAEASVMRAFYYYLLTSFFGDVPFYTEDVDDVETMNRIASLPRMSAYETRRYLIEELKGLLSYDDSGAYTGILPRVRTSDNEGNRAGWAVGEMLIAKMSMWNAVTDDSWYDVALEACLHLEEVYGDLSAYPLSDIPFRMKNTPESIFEVQHTWSSGGLSYVSNLASVCMPRKYDYTDADGNVIVTWGADYTHGGVIIDELGDDASAWTPSRPNLYFCRGIQTESGGDARASMNMAWSYNGTTIPETSSRPWMGPKFWCPGMYLSNDSNNYKIFRYADTVLMAAECYTAKGDGDNAVRYLNEVRRRAGLPDYEWRGARKTLLEIQDERGRELFGEFQRKFDLVRWGIWYERVKSCNDYSQLQDNLRPCHEYLPIPDKQVIYSGYALDNTEYNKYGL